MHIKLVAGSAPKVEDEINVWLGKFVNCEPPAVRMIEESFRMNVTMSHVVVAFFYEKLEPVRER